jgi:hypothetical protein
MKVARRFDLPQKAILRNQPLDAYHAGHGLLGLGFFGTTR